MTRSLAGVVPPDDPARSSPVLDSAPVSDAAFEGAAEFGPVLALLETRSPLLSVLRMIFIAGAFGGGVLFECGRNSDNGVGLFGNCQPYKPSDLCGHSQSTERSAMQSNRR